jgi:protein TonB
LGSGQAQSIAGSPGGNPILTKIVTRINRSKYYPEAARRDKIEGRPEVLFQIGPDGSISLVELKRSSGNKLLDDAALETVRRAAPLPYYEAPISVAINYILD